jgi:subtilisin family serine protease
MKHRAIEQAWADGIVVIACAGNTGSKAEAVTVPGNDPYVITVGAINGNRTPGYWPDDILPSWSAGGPTWDGFAKPDVLAPIYTGGRGGLEACLMNTYNLPARPLYTIAPLTLHECTPGHSFQAALALEGPERPAFRRGTSFSGYGEGWGLYTEWLGTVMGIYETPYEDMGRLTYEMWRACRLVIDTGIHQFGWSREQAMGYLRDHAALAEHEITTEVERYIAWPGQALAYKLGELQIRRTILTALGLGVGVLHALLISC